MGGALPLIYSILGDMYKADERHKANAFVGMGTGIGIAVGQGIAGFLGPTFGWRLPFLVVSAPALICAAIVAVTVKDPERGRMEEATLERRQVRTDESKDGDETDCATSKQIEMRRLNSGEEPKEFEGMPESPNTPQPAAFGVPRKRSKEYPSGEKSNGCSEECTGKNKGVVSRVLWSRLKPTVKASMILFRTPTVVFAMLQGIPGCLPWGIGKYRPHSWQFLRTSLLCHSTNFISMPVSARPSEYLFE